jgi:hypothetical protein
VAVVLVLRVLVEALTHMTRMADVRDVNTMMATEAHGFPRQMGQPIHASWYPQRLPCLMLCWPLWHSGTLTFLWATKCKTHLGATYAPEVWSWAEICLCCCPVCQAVAHLGLVVGLTGAQAPMVLAVLEPEPEPVVVVVVVARKAWPHLQLCPGIDPHPRTPGTKLTARDCGCPAVPSSTYGAS